MVRGRALGIHEGGATHVVMLYVGKGLEREQWHLLHSLLLFIHSPPPTMKLGLSGADSQVGGLVYVLGPCGSLQ